MIIEKKEIVAVPVEDNSTSVGMIILVALIALAVGITAFYFATSGQNSQYIERNTEVHDVTPVTVPQPAPQPIAAPQPIVVPQPVVVPQAAPVQQPAPPAPAAQPQQAPAQNSTDSSDSQ